MKNTCPNCGAAMDLNVCHYCGTMLVNLLDIDLDDSRQVWLQVRHDGHVVRMRATMHEVEITARPEITTYTTMTGDTFMHNGGTSLEVECRFSGWLE